MEQITTIFQSGLYLNQVIALTDKGEVMIGEYSTQDNVGMWHIVDKIKWKKI